MKSSPEGVNNAVRHQFIIALLLFAVISLDSCKVNFLWPEVDKGCFMLDNNIICDISVDLAGLEHMTSESDIKRLVEKYRSNVPDLAPKSEVDKIIFHYFPDSRGIEKGGSHVIRVKWNDGVKLYQEFGDFISKQRLNFDDIAGLPQRPFPLTRGGLTGHLRKGNNYPGEFVKDLIALIEWKEVLLKWRDKRQGKGGRNG